MFFYKKNVINFQFCCNKKYFFFDKKKIKEKIKKILCLFTNYYEITIRMVEKKEIKYLNKKYRKMNYATNILSFHYNKSLNKSSKYIFGDLILCPYVIYKESLNNKIYIFEYYMHIIVHGLLHLFGYDHYSQKDANLMEFTEKKIIKMIGF
ncbi:MAG: rRNA maturation RNase YbeY [Enterobacteriaceae bacterium]